MDPTILRRTDLVVVRPDATRAEVRQWCAEALKRPPLAVCVLGSRVEVAADALGDSGIKVSALIGFPFGAADADVKRYEVDAAVEAGAQELDYVVNLGWVREGNLKALLREMRDIREAAEERPVKAIVEVSLLTPEQVHQVAGSVMEAELQFIVTATGCAGRPTTVEDVQKIRDAVGPALGIKVVGGVGDRATAEALIAAGANRLGVLQLADWLVDP